MNPVTLLRSRTGITQQALASGAGTSQPTIAQYESGDKSPTLVTLQRLASSQGLELIVSYVPRLTREDRRSLSYHQVVAKILRERFSPTIRRAKQLLAKMSAHHPEAGPLIHCWRDWLNLPGEELISRMLDPGMVSREMRQVCPFAGLLAPQDRARILKRFRKEYRS